MLSNLLILFKTGRQIQATRRNIRTTREVLKYWWVLIGIFLLLWLFLSLTGSTTEIAFAWALIGTLLLGFPFVAVIALFNRAVTGGAPAPESYWPQQGASENHANEWMEDLQKDRPSHSQIDDIINKYRNNPDRFDTSTGG